MTDVKILVALHQASDVPENDVFMPIQAGKMGASIKLPFQGDDEGENISQKNPGYNELTAYYWAWKNLKTDIIGLSHYRRYFHFGSGHFSSSIKIIKREDLEEYLPTKADIGRALSGCDIILAKPLIVNYSMYVYYASFHIREDLEILTKAIENLYPDYKKTWNDFLHNSNKFSPYSMLVCRKEIFDDYCEWLFPILFEVEKKVKMSPYAYQKRVIAFMGERLLNLYGIHNKLKIKHKTVLLVLNEDQKKYSRSRENLKTILSYLSGRLSNFSFYLGNLKTKINL